MTLAMKAGRSVRSRKNQKFKSDGDAGAKRQAQPFNQKLQALNKLNRAIE
jgi:hypothetical protein